MCPELLADEVEEAARIEEIEGRSGALPPERFNRRQVSQRTRKRARRSRSNDMAKRGMHRRRNKRGGW